MGQMKEASGDIFQEIADNRIQAAQSEVPPAERHGRSFEKCGTPFPYGEVCFRQALSFEERREAFKRELAALRERYHMEACSGMNYARSADGTTDPCLGKLLNELSADEYRHAEELMSMLERAMQG